MQKVKKSLLGGVGGNKKRQQGNPCCPIFSEDFISLLS